MPVGPRPRPPAGLARAVFSGSMAGSTWVNVVWLRCTTSADPSGAQMNALATFVGNAWASNIIKWSSSVALMTHCSIQLYGTGEDIFKGEATFGIAGTRAASVNPAQVSAAVSWTTLVGYRGGHPRSYLPGIAVADTVSVKTLSPTFTSGLAADALICRTAINGYATSPFTAVELGTCSFQRAKNWRNPPVFVPYTGAIVDNRIDTQRRRLGPDV